MLFHCYRQEHGVTRDFVSGFKVGVEKAIYFASWSGLLVGFSRQILADPSRVAKLTSREQSLLESVVTTLEAAATSSLDSDFPTRLQVFRVRLRRLALRLECTNFLDVCKRLNDWSTVESSSSDLEF